ncbi:MAG: ABC transporter ATP-binding protein [Dictyoglomus thermophilum]|uniref:ABC transporter ATP-binding protein n=1 Tax=Dictyoglomus thermophilum TaxID=14 RepID=A0A7V3ZHG5_DICTH|nr:ABC transporter ATP-binding protein [Dictyoglomus thermophilum]MCX7720209.1 ABC transporter ATP-binding protein [Dictyoglomus thermophilum]TYT23327.1 ABC transporter ATP-binding protein [Dictyoglomus thermophilum]
MGILEVSNLYKDYGKKLALKNINLSFDLGQIVGLYGPNGSGKTTFLKIIAGLLRPSKGKIMLDGREIGVYTKSIVAYLPDRNILPLWMKVRDARNFYKDFFDFDEARFKSLLEFFELREELNLRELSKGDLEKILLSLTLSRKAKVYLLDEPLGGMDPSTRDKVITSILRSYHEESLMIIATHLIGEIENITERTIFIHNGELVLDDNTEKIREEKGVSINELFKKMF